MRDDLCMFETGPEGSHVNALERRLECIDNKGICSITDGVDILITAPEYRKWERHALLTVCQPSLRNLCMVVVRTC